MGLTSEVPTLHMSFTGNPGTGKTTVALRIASILHKLGFVRRGQVVSVTRDELVGQYIGHTAPKTKEVLKKAMGGVLFIDEAYYLHRPDNERDYGQEAIEILLQVMESQRDDMVVILAGYGDRMEKFFASNPGFRSRIAHHIDFPDYSDGELLSIAELMMRAQSYEFSTKARDAFIRYIALRKTQPLFSNARSIRNGLDRLRLRQASRLISDLDRVITIDDVKLIEASDVLLAALRAAARLMCALPSYDGWPAWTVSVHDERGSLVETLPFAADTHRRDALHFEEGIARWTPHSPPNPHQTGSTRYH